MNVVNLHAEQEKILCLRSSTDILHQGRIQGAGRRETLGTRLGRSLDFKEEGGGGGHTVSHPGYQIVMSASTMCFTKSDIFSDK